VLHANVATQVSCCCCRLHQATLISVVPPALDASAAHWSPVHNNNCWQWPGTQLQWPRGGPQAIADALVRGLRKFGGKLLLRSHVVAVLAGPTGQAAGVQVTSAASDRGRKGAAAAAAVPRADIMGGVSTVIRARKGVVSNASLWDTLKLVPQQAVLADFRDQVCCLPPSQGPTPQLPVNKQGAALLLCQ
jgi:hypothetical protein